MDDKSHFCPSSDWLEAHKRKQFKESICMDHEQKVRVWVWEHYRMLKNVPRYSLFPFAPEALLDSWFSSVTGDSAWEGSCTFEGQQVRDAETPQQSWQLRKKRVHKLLNHTRYMLWTKHLGHAAYVSAPGHMTGSGMRYITS